MEGYGENGGSNHSYFELDFVVKLKVDVEDFDIIE